MNIANKKSHNISFQNLNRKEYFEGWYYKLVSEDENTIISFIPSFHRTKESSYAMLQCVLGEYNGNEWKIKTDFIKYNSRNFIVSNEPFNLNLKENLFREDKIKIDFSGKFFNINGQVNLSNFKRLPQSFLCPDIMGFFSYLPGLECIHDIVSLDHRLEGNLNINEKPVSFRGGRGYIEKDLGSSFPKYYIWVQSNHFNTRPSSLFFSFANIPVGPTSFDGFICHLWTGSEDIRFGTYNMDSCNISKDGPRKVNITLENKNYKLEIFAHKKSFVDLEAPIKGIMSATIKEGLGAYIKYSLLNKKTGKITQDKTSIGGVEITDKLSPKK